MAMAQGPITRRPIAKGFTAVACIALGMVLGTSQPARAETVLERISRTGQLKAVVMNGDLPYTTQQGNGYVGLGVEFSKEIHQEISDYSGKTVQLVSRPVHSVAQGIAAIVKGEADLACGVGFSWGRAMFVDYTVPFALSGTRLITPVGNDGTPEALTGSRIGAVTNSLAVHAIEKTVRDAELVLFENPKEALAALKNGEISILAGDSLWLLANRTAVDPRGHVTPTVPYNRSAVGCIAAENNSDLLDISNLAIGRLMQAYVNNDRSAQKRINAWIGPGSSVDLSQAAIKGYFTNVLLNSALLGLP